MPKGGVRPGAGRPKGSLNEETRIKNEMRKIWLVKLEERAGEIFNAHLDLALGVHMYVPLENGGVRTYRKPPNGLALEWLQEQIFGKAKQQLHVEGEIDMEGKLDRKASALISQALNHVIASAQNIGSADTRGSDVQESTGA